MITFIVCIAILILGYLFYGRYLERVVGVDPNRETPATRLYDGVDYVPMSWGRIFMIQFLNIAGLGPIFGAVAGAMFGPVVFLWVVIGCIFGGAVHDYLSGMMSLRQDGMSIPEIVGKYLGNNFKIFMRVFTIFLLIQVGAIFVKGPAEIMSMLTPGAIDITLWGYIIFAYYFLATILPIDQLIGRIYPLFGLALLFMAVAITGGILFQGYTIPELTPDNIWNMHRNSATTPVFPIMFISVACGAISGFHSTQSPLMSRCLKNENLGRRVFMGAMIAEGIVALIWAAAGMSFFGGVMQLNEAVLVNKMSYPTIIHTISETLLGKFGAVLAILGVVAAPITSGDTAFRSARLIIGDILKFNQVPIKNRLIVSVPLFVIGYILVQVDFTVIWRYFTWSNQTLAVIVLWAITSYLIAENKKYWISLLPALFMTMVCSTYILIAPEGLALSYYTGLIVSAVITMVVTAWFFASMKKVKKV